MVTKSLPRLSLVATYARGYPTGQVEGNMTGDLFVLLDDIFPLICPR
jgi:hypothetical protein